MTDRSFAGELRGGPPQEINPHDALKRIEEQIARAEKENTRILARLEKALEDAKARGVNGAALQNYRDRLSEHQALVSWAAKEREQDRAAIRERLKAEENAAQLVADRALGAAKEAHRQAWLKNGGSFQNFEKYWKETGETEYLAKAIDVELAKETAILESKRRAYDAL